MDDLTLFRDLETVEKDVTTIQDATTTTGLQLNTCKCEIISEDFTRISTSSVFRDFTRVGKDDSTLLGSPLMKGRTQEKGDQG